MTFMIIIKIKHISYFPYNYNVLIFWILYFLYIFEFYANFDCINKFFLRLKPLNSSLYC